MKSLARRKTGFQPVMADSASCLSAIATIGWKPVGRDRQDASPPANESARPGWPCPSQLSLTPNAVPGTMPVRTPDTRIHESIYLFTRLITMMKSLNFAATAMCLLIAALAGSAGALPPDSSIAPGVPGAGVVAAKLKWFDEAKYGLFINWGLYSMPAGEWQGKKYGGIGEWLMHDAKIPVKEYEELAKQFNPQKFDAGEWAQLAEDAGMKYLVFDCKHHDGFALFHSAVSKYNCYDATPWQRDPMKELQTACSKHNIKLCFYYSQATDWHEPNGGMNNWDFKPDKEKDFDQYLRDKSLPQVKELLTNYGPIGLIWFDVPVMMTAERSKWFADLVHSIQPATLINSRLGAGNLHDYQSMGDNEIPNKVLAGAWETAATINDTWGYKTADHNWKQPDNITFKLVDIVSKGGNYLLNVGPTGDGSIPQPSQDILRRVGKWLKVNGEAVYGAGRTPLGGELAKSEWRCTVQPADWTWGKPGKLYFHLFKWPAAGDGDVRIFGATGVKCKLKKSYLLADPEREPLQMELSAPGDMLTVKLPEKACDELDSVLCVEVE